MLFPFSQRIRDRHVSTLFPLFRIPSRPQRHLGRYLFILLYSPYSRLSDFPAVGCNYHPLFTAVALTLHLILD